MIRCCRRKDLRLCVRSDEYELGSSDDIKSWLTEDGGRGTDGDERQ